MFIYIFIAHKSFHVPEFLSLICWTDAPVVMSWSNLSCINESLETEHPPQSGLCWILTFFCRKQRQINTFVVLLCNKEKRVFITVKLKEVVMNLKQIFIIIIIIAYYAPKEFWKLFCSPGLFTQANNEGCFYSRTNEIFLKLLIKKGIITQVSAQSSLDAPDG